MSTPTPSPDRTGANSADLARLADKFTAHELEWRIQQAGEKNGRIWAIAVPYVTARAIQERLDQVCGIGNWRNTLSAGPTGGMLCGLSIRVDRGDGIMEWVTKMDVAEATEVEPVKGAASGALKRAAVQWGIGRYLYALEDMFADVTENGRLRGTFKRKKGQGQNRGDVEYINFRWNPPRLPAWALPEDRREEGTGQGHAGGQPNAEEEAKRRTAHVHQARLAYIRRVGASVPPDAEVTRKGHGKVKLREFLRDRDNWSTIKDDPALAEAVVVVIERVTEEPFNAETEAVHGAA